MQDQDLPTSPELIEVRGAREHNLKNIDVNIPRDQLVVITGLSGSGKSSLAFNTLYAEGQRRYMETFSAYARQFLGNIERPDVDQITGLSPVISIEQKTISRNPRSTVGTITEIYDFLRLLYARVARAYSYETGELMVQYSEEQIVELILQHYPGQKLTVLAPLVKGRKGHYGELFEQILKQGFLRARIDGTITELSKGLRVDRYKVHDIEVVVDRVVARSDERQRLRNTVTTALDMGKGSLLLYLHEGDHIRHFSRELMCPTTGISYPSPEPNLFSFNSPYGACSRCNGLGMVSEIDRGKIIPDEKKSIKKGGLAPLGSYKNTWIFKQVEALLAKYQFTLDMPLGELSDDLIEKLLSGTDETVRMAAGDRQEYSMEFEGIANFIARQAEDNPSAPIQRWAKSFMNQITCPKCEGKRLKREAFHFKIDGENIADVSALDIQAFHRWMEKLDKVWSERENRIARDILKEIRSRASFLTDVGLEYLSLDRSARTLSGGEAQRIRLATQIGARLVGVLYILDEPSIGLHQRDNHRLIASLKSLRDAGNSVIVVEHDKDMILEADHVIDIGPRAGISGGQIVAQASGADFANHDSITADYLRGDRYIAVPKRRRKGSGKNLQIIGAKGHNLKNIKVNFPLGTFICVTGVSGSGKSSLIDQTLYPLLNAHVYKGVRKPLAYTDVKGLEHIDKVIEIDQSPIGRSPRSNPATYTNLFTDVRQLFAELPEAKIRGYKPGRFSFNTSGGRCETCKGAGLRTIEMNILPDVYVTCETCQGKRYSRETLEVRYKGHSISDVLDMTMHTAADFFTDHPKIAAKLQTLIDVGLGYLTLGQQSTTLSGGEAQRIKLSTELSKRGTGSTFYILDEPTTGLHFEDVRLLLEVLGRLVDQGNTVLVVEHNLDVIKVADHLIDLGPEGGAAGGYLVASGTPEQVAKKNKGYTAQYLQAELT